MISINVKGKSNKYKNVNNFNLNYKIIYNIKIKNLIICSLEVQ